MNARKVLEAELIDMQKERDAAWAELALLKVALEEARKARDVAEARARWINGILACKEVKDLTQKLPPDVLMSPLPFSDRLDYAGKMIQAVFDKLTKK